MTRLLKDINIDDPIWDHINKLGVKHMLVGWRTYIISFMVATVAILEMTDWNALFDNPQAGLVALGSAIVMALLRTITTTPPGTAGPVAKPTDTTTPKV